MQTEALEKIKSKQKNIRDLEVKKVNKIYSSLVSSEVLSFMETVMVAFCQYCQDYQFFLIQIENLLILFKLLYSTF